MADVVLIIIVRTRYLDGNVGKCYTQVQPEQSGFFGHPLNLTFTTKLLNCHCISSISTTGQPTNLNLFTTCLIHNHNSSIPKHKLRCSRGCGNKNVYNITLPIKNVTSDNIGIYTLVIAPNGCGCTLIYESSVNLTAQGWSNYRLTFVPIYYDLF